MRRLSWRMRTHTEDPWQRCSSPAPMRLTEGVPAEPRGDHCGSLWAEDIELKTTATYRASGRHCGQHERSTGAFTAGQARDRGGYRWTRRCMSPQLRLASHIPQAALSNFPMACHPIACARPRMLSFLSIPQTSSHAPSRAPCQLIMPWHVRPMYQACLDPVVWSSTMLLCHQVLSTHATSQADRRRRRDCNRKANNRHQAPNEAELLPAVCFQHTERSQSQPCLDSDTSQWMHNGYQASAWPNRCKPNASESMPELDCLLGCLHPAGASNAYPLLRTLEGCIAFVLDRNNAPLRLATCRPQLAQRPKNTSSLRPSQQ